MMNVTGRKCVACRGPVPEGRGRTCSDLCWSRVSAYWRRRHERTLAFRRSVDAARRGGEEQ